MLSRRQIHSINYITMSVKSYLLLTLNLLLAAAACKQNIQDDKPFIIELYKSRDFREIDSMFEILSESVDQLHLKTTFVDTQGVWYHVFSEGYASRDHCLTTKIGYEDNLGLDQLKVYDHRTLKSYYIDNQDFSPPAPPRTLPQLIPNLAHTLNYIPYLTGFQLKQLLILNKSSQLPSYLLDQFYKTLDLPRGISQTHIQTQMQHGFQITYSSHYGYSECLLTLLKMKSTFPNQNHALAYARRITKAGYYEQKEIEPLEPVGQWQFVYRIFIKSSSKNIEKTYYLLGTKNNPYICFLEIKDYEDNILDTFDKQKNIRHYSRFAETFYYLPSRLPNNQTFYAFQLSTLENFNSKPQLYLNGGVKSQAYFFDSFDNKRWSGKLYKFYTPANARHIYENWFPKGEAVQYKTQWAGKFKVRNRTQGFIAYRIRDYVFILNASNPTSISKQTWQTRAEAWQF